MFAGTKEPVPRGGDLENPMFEIINEMQSKYEVPVYNSESGYSMKGIDLGSNNFKINKPVKVALLIGEGVNAYEAGEVWHLLDTRIGMALTKIKLNQFNDIAIDKYTTLIMVNFSVNINQFMDKVILLLMKLVISLFHLVFGVKKKMVLCKRYKKFSQMV